MELTHLGDGLVKLTSRKFQMVVGPKLPADKSGIDLVALTQGSENAAGMMVLDAPGEYEVSGVLITGVAAKLNGDQDGELGTCYVIDDDASTVAVLANIAAGLSNAQLEVIGQPDVLVIPVEGKDTLKASDAAAIVAQVEPKVVIPVGYDSVDAFIKELGATPQEATKYKVAKDLGEELVVVVLKPESKTAAKATS